MTPENPSWADHTLFAVLAIGSPLGGLAFRRALDAARPERLPALRLPYYLGYGSLLWILVALAVLIWKVESRRWMELGVVLFCTVHFWVLVVAFAVILALSLKQYARLLQQPERLVIAGRRLGTPRWLPSRPGEQAGYLFHSASAGLCEEILYRAFLCWYLGHWLPILAAGAVSALLFGARRIYQGAREAQKQAVIGFALFGIYYMAGSIFAPAAFHLLLNLQSAQLTFAAIRAEERDPGLLARAEAEAKRA